MLSQADKNLIISAFIEHGWSARKIKKELNIAVTHRSIQRLLQPYQRHQPSGRLPMDIYQDTFRQIIVEAMVRRGHDPHVCDQCGKRQKKICDIHHTKYEGATVDDLQFVCRECNLAPRNIGLQ